MAKTQKNKATSYHLGQLKAKLAKLKRELLTPSSSGGGGGAGFDVARTGVASIGFIGFPSVGKSTLMSRLTGQHSEAAAYEFTTLTSVPGQVIYNGATQPLTHIDHDEIKAVMSEYRINSADITIRCDATIDDLIDVIEAKSRSYIPVVYCLNKIDSISIEELDLLYRIPNAVPISSEHGWNIDELMEAMWEKLNLKRVYTKPKGRQPDYSAPVVLRANRCTVEDFCNAIHRSIVEQFKSAIVYGKSVKHQPQRVGLAHELEDEDVGKCALSQSLPPYDPTLLRYK
ncbi:P-loop containing nucleoside triphosphate hydrolase protein [Trichoderma longibrachiatum ATCC 18648]|uniref:P-loop containing nucleoside triphosphate hydrolase protein n=1 Tax=Trichoderma longibrachiatum ATCC 18648 TaxID=983965 RepID=A0A2T4CHZ7_TRILO|nr:P-loop containing nucleoside triphosphate hydrolase protein [Trichoderma longibrachiatum ATCC 18648]